MIRHNAREAYRFNYSTNFDQKENTTPNLHRRYFQEYEKHSKSNDHSQMLEEYLKNARGPAMYDVLCEFAAEGQFVKEALLDNLEDRFDLQKQRRTILSRMGEFLQSRLEALQAHNNAKSLQMKEEQ